MAAKLLIDGYRGIIGLKGLKENWKECTNF